MPFDQNPRRFRMQQPAPVTGSAPIAPEPPAAYVSRGLVESLLGANTYLSLFVLALLMPTYMSFSLGPMRLTVYRLFLILGFIPCAAQLMSPARFRMLPSDRLVAASAFWAAATFLYHEGLGTGLEPAGIFVLETLGAYLLGRVLVQDERAFRGFVALVTVIICGLLLFTLPESVFGKNLFGLPPSGMEKRMGLTRAQGCFDHPIIHGVFCASAFAMSWRAFAPGPHRSNLARIFQGALISVTAMTSVSSGAIAALFVQWILLFWVHLTRRIQRRWQLFSALVAAMYVTVDTLSNRTPMLVFFSYLTLSPETAYGRMIIWDWGFYENALKHPLLGIGLADWVRPSWLFSGSMDNFWLVLMVQNGLPCFLFLAWGMISLLRLGSKGARQQGVSELFMGWSISVVGLVIAACTVHLWNAALVYLFFLLGAGAWFAGRRPDGAHSHGV